MSLPPSAQHGQVQDRLLRCECETQAGEVGLTGISICRTWDGLLFPGQLVRFFQQCNDVGLMAYLGTITKTCNTMNQFVNKFNVLYDRQGIGRRMRGLFF